MDFLVLEFPDGLESLERVQLVLGRVEDYLQVVGEGETVESELGVELGLAGVGVGGRVLPAAGPDGHRGVVELDILGLDDGDDEGGGVGGGFSLPFQTVLGQLELVEFEFLMSPRSR